MKIIANIAIFLITIMLLSCNLAKNIHIYDACLHNFLSFHEL